MTPEEATKWHEHYEKSKNKFMAIIMAYDEGTGIELSERERELVHFICYIIRDYLGIREYVRR